MNIEPGPREFREARICACGNHGFVGLTVGGVALVSPSDTQAITGRLWALKQGYAQRTDYSGGRKTQLKMHRVILGVSADQKVDHRNHDKTDNRRENIRACSHQKNMRNRKAWGSHAYKGVDYYPPTNSYRARITCEGGTKNLGYFKSAEDAADAYDAAALVAHGQYALTNKMMGLLDGEAVAC